MNAREYRELAKSFRELAYSADTPRKVSLLRNIAHSLSGLASQLEALARESQPAMAKVSKSGRASA